MHPDAFGSEAHEVLHRGTSETSPARDGIGPGANAGFYGFSMSINEGTIHIGLMIRILFQNCEFSFWGPAGSFSR